VERNAGAQAKSARQKRSCGNGNLSAAAEKASIDRILDALRAKRTVGTCAEALNIIYHEKDLRGFCYMSIVLFFIFKVKRFARKDAWMELTFRGATDIIYGKVWFFEKINGGFSLC
jgi:hypothetical protein